MDKIRIKGGTPLKGTIPVSGAKNASLPLMAACLLSDKPLHLSNIPHLADIASMATLLGQLGVELSFSGEEKTGGHMARTLILDAGKMVNTVAPYELVRKMRASVLVLGPLLARFGKAEVSLPGGCAIGTRPVDLHLKSLAQMGADITIEDGYVKAEAPKGLQGCEFTFPLISVGATENAMMAAVLANGTTILNNVALEPEIVDLAKCLNSMGAKIKGEGTNTLEITGVSSLKEAHHAIIPDRIETATYAIAGAITRGDIILKDAALSHIQSVADKLKEAGIMVTDTPEGIHIRGGHNRIESVDISTAPYPAYPTDAQAQIMALMCVADGASTIHETIFENRFMHVPELMRMGADITLNGSTAVIKGVNSLKGAQVMATDLRASVCLVLAGLAAEGMTTISRVYHLDRGYERLEEKLQACGADINRIQ